MSTWLDWQELSRLAAGTAGPSWHHTKARYKVHHADAATCPPAYFLSLPARKISNVIFQSMSPAKFSFTIYDSISKTAFDTFRGHEEGGYPAGIVLPSIQQMIPATVHH